MLGNLWSWNGSNDGSKDFEDGSTQFSDSVENEDELASRMLTQFPAYGTNEPKSEWLQDSDDGEDDTVRPSTLQRQQQSAKSPSSPKILDWDESEQRLWKKNTGSPGKISYSNAHTVDFSDNGLDAKNHGPSTTPSHSASSTPSRPFSISPRRAGQNTEDWMPDQLCKTCYSCEMPFTVFRRRHHCRLCGQVFCSNCSAFFVESTENGVRKSLRACQLCYEQYQKKEQVAAEASKEVPQTKLSLQPQHRNTSLEELDEALVPATVNNAGANSNALVSASQSIKSPTTASLALVHRQNSLSPQSNPGHAAASQLEQLGWSLMESDAPLLWESLTSTREREEWVDQLMSLATQCCRTVDPNVKANGDLLDILRYVKLKVIPGGSVEDCAYMSGIIFRKAPSHKRMARELENPRIMLLSGGIDFTRTENRIASLDTLLEQENKYTEILVGKILKLQPDLVLVGRSVSRKAQELLLKSRVVLIQHVKATLLQRISRQTGATLFSSTDHVMMQSFGPNVLGKCHRFRIVTFRDHEAWSDQMVVHDSEKQKRSIPALLLDDDLPNHERQAALAAAQLGESVLDGAEAVKTGLAKRGVAHTYVMLEGCPKHLGCSIVLRGGSQAALKQVKKVLSFIIKVAYNLKLETCYLRERCARLPSKFEVQPKHLFSSSLCVDYGDPPSGRKVRPWNGQETQLKSISGKTTALDHQSILITSVWMTDKTQCCPAEVKGICYYSLQDVSLGQFLRDSCFNLSLKCQNPNCKKSVLDHTLSFIHNDGLINITVEHMEEPLPPAPVEKQEAENDAPIATWTYCVKCHEVVTPLVFVSDQTWKLSFGKFLEVFFYNRDAVINAPDHKCSCNMQTDSILYFGCGRLAARFTYEPVKPFGVFVRRSLPMDESFHRADAVRQLEQISVASSELFVKFDKHIEKVSREARSLFHSAANRPEHLQTVLSQLNMIGSEVDHAAKTLQEKIASVSDKCREGGQTGGIMNEALFRFPWYARRYLFMLTSAWNERLSAAGQALVAMKKLAGGNRGIEDGSTDELMEGMRRLRMLNDVYSQYNVTDISTVLPTLPGSGMNKEDLDDDDFEDPDGAMDFSEGVDADVLASRRRFAKDSGSKGRPRKSLGTQRAVHTESDLDSSGGHHRRGDGPSPVNSQSLSKANRTVTPGGAVKSALTRFFNRGGKEMDPYVVDLGLFKDGRPRLEPGVGGIVLPVIDDTPTTVIAYSLSSAEYEKQFKHFSKAEVAPPPLSRGPPPNADATFDSADLGPAHPRDPSRKPEAAGKPSVGASSQSVPLLPTDDRKDIERRMLVRSKTHIKHTFRDFDDKGLQTCKFVCTTYWSTQFHAVRQAFLSQSSKEEGTTPPSALDIEKCYVQSLSSAYSWAASGGKSGASFARTADDRFVIKCISRTELQMFLDCAPAYFEYLSKAFFHGLPTILCKIVGVYQIGYHNRVTGKRSMEQVAVMQNIFYKRKISKTFDLKGSLRGRFARHLQGNRDNNPGTPTNNERRASRGDSDTDSGDEVSSDGFKSESDGNSKPELSSEATLLDGDFLEFTNGRPLPLSDRAKAVFHMSVLNDTLFLSIINVLDYSILVGIEENTQLLVLGIIDFMRQYDILKQMERVGKSLPMVVGSEAPTIIQPPLYKARFTNAMERYFMTVPNKWTTI